MDNKALTNLLHFEDEYVWIKPICDFFEINDENQSRSIRKNPFLSNHSTKKSNSSLFGDNYRRVLVDKFGCLVWIAGINPNIIAEEKREAFKQFQNLIYEFMHGSVQENQRIKQLYAEKKVLALEMSKNRLRMGEINKLLDAYHDKRYLQGELPLNDSEPKQLGSGEQEAAE